LPVSIDHGIFRPRPAASAASFHAPSHRLLLCLCAAALNCQSVAELFVPWYSGGELVVDVVAWVGWGTQIAVNAVVVVYAWRCFRLRPAA